ncbi:uncharacterized protein [Primulina eburnea]|uniref:uncharacterized protein n=1 Tax=Primulina eburnea TaxID=1245227 RepID=UPI003C6BE631
MVTPSSMEVVPSVPAIISASIITSVMATPLIPSSNASGAPAINPFASEPGALHKSEVEARSSTFASLALATIGPVRHPTYHENQFPPSVHQLFFPLPSLHSRDLLLSRRLLPHSEPSQFKSWPRVPEGWVEWIDRLTPHFGQQWRHQGLWPLVVTSKMKINKQSVLFDCLLRFWSPSSNVFIFPFGPMSITLYDISLFLGLPVVGPDSPYFIDDPAAPTLAHTRYCYPSYRAVVKEWSSHTGVPSVVEHVMFLWVLICHYIFCPSSGKPSSEYLPLACSLSTGRVYNLAVMLLGSVYRSLNQCVRHDPISKLGGVSWFLQIWAFSYFPGVMDFLAGPPTMLRITSLMGSHLTLSASDLMDYLQRLKLDTLNLPARPSVSCLTRPFWVGAFPDFNGRSPDEIAALILTRYIHPRLLVVDCSSTRPPYNDKSSWSFEFYNPSLYAYQFWLSPAVPHTSLSFPVDLTHIVSEIASRRLSKATVQLLSTLSGRFLSPMVPLDRKMAESFAIWWKSRYLDLIPSVIRHPDARKRDVAPSEDSPVSVKLPKMDTQGSLKLKQEQVTVPPKSQSLKTKAAPKAAPTGNITRRLQTVGRRYHTRHSTKLVSGPSNTVDDPIILGEDDPPLVSERPSPKNSSPEVSDINEAFDTDFSPATSEQGVLQAGISGVKFDTNPDVSEERATDNPSILRDFPSTAGFSPNSPNSLPVAVTLSMDLTSRRARLKLIGEPEIQVDLSFSDDISSMPSNLERCTPSVEALAHAKMAIRNFLGLGLHQLGESQRLAMLSSVSILKTSSEFATSEFGILDDLPTIFSKSDAAFATSSDMISQRTSFQSKREKKEELDKHDKVVREQIAAVTASYDVEEAEVKRLEEEIHRRRARMVTLLDEAETLEAALLETRKNSHTIGHQLFGLKNDYHMWTSRLHEAEITQSECLAKWEQLRTLFP